MKRFILAAFAAATLFGVGATFTDRNPAARPVQQTADVSLPADAVA